jgi:ubiquinone/menaquinone biosynthesis C-methylase UbiE
MGMEMESAKEGAGRPVALTERQAREVAYHSAHAAVVAGRLRGLDRTVLTEPRRRWWNAYWSIWTYLLTSRLAGTKVLVVGCGAGEDALLFACLGAEVSAFDLSPDMLDLARQSAEREGLNVRFDLCPSEALVYADQSFDLIFARDILHHVDIPSTMRELARVARPNAALIVDEIYSHSWTELVRRSWLVDRVLYPSMLRWIYGKAKPYITADERKMTETDIDMTVAHARQVQRVRYYNMIVTRLLPDRLPLASKIDRLLLMALGPLGRFLAGRVVITARMP